FKWEWAEVPKKFEWKEGDYIYIPPFTTHQHFATAEARLIMMSNRMVKEMGYDWFDQVENAPGFEPGQKSAGGGPRVSVYPCCHLGLARRRAAPHICAAVARPAGGICAVPGGILQGPQRRALYRLQRGRRLRPLCARAGPSSGQAHPGQPDHHSQEHGGRRKP